MFYKLPKINSEATIRQEGRHKVLGFYAYWYILQLKVMNDDESLGYNLLIRSFHNIDILQL